MKKKIIILPGDGIGKEVTAEGKKVLIKIAELFDHQFEFDEAAIGHDAIEATGNPLPDETLAKLKNCDAILFGAKLRSFSTINLNLTKRPSAMMPSKLPAIRCQMKHWPN